MIYILLKSLVYLGATIITSYAVYLVFKGALTSLNEKIEVERRMRKNKVERKNVHLGIVKDASFIENVYRDLDNMLMITKKNYQKTSTVQNFVIYHFVMFGILSIFIGGLSQSYLFGAALAILFVYGNFMRHRVKLRVLRIDRGYQLAELTGAIASTYNSSMQPQMKITLRDVVKENPDSPFKKQLQEIIRIDQNYVHPEELMIGIDSFVYSINTSFARELGFTLYKSLTTKEFVGDTLIRIDVKIHQNILDIKNETAEKTDVKNLSWFHLIAFPGTFLLLTLFLNITDESILHYQFQTAQGRAGFLLSVLFIGMARVVASWFLRQPNDY